MEAEPLKALPQAEPGIELLEAEPLKALPQAEPGNQEKQEEINQSKIILDPKSQNKDDQSLSVMSETGDCEWRSPPQDLSLSDNEVHIWRADLGLPADVIQQFGQILSTDERQRGQRFHFERDRRRFIAGRGILRTILGRYLAVAPDQIEFCYGPHGKPALADSWGQPPLCFNLSHSGDLALYAISCDRQIGVDIEQIRIVEADQLAQRFFSPNEYAVIQALPSQQQQTAFFQLWTCKEAALKATGKGIAGLAEVEISLGIEAPAQLIRLNGDSLSIDNWSIQQLTPAPGYVAALASEGRDLKVSNLRFLSHYEKPQS